jgi:hypothetical protein
MSDPNSTSSDILSDGPVKDILRPVYCPFDGLFPIEVAKGLSQLGLLEDFHFF